MEFLGTLQCITSPPGTPLCIFGAPAAQAMQAISAMEKATQWQRALEILRFAVDAQARPFRGWISLVGHRAASIPNTELARVATGHWNSLRARNEVVDSY